jgi:hypothetical protein
MFPNNRVGQVILALGTLILTLAVLLPPVTFRLTEFGIAHHGAGIRLVGEGTQHVNSSVTVLHVGGCKFIGHRSICAHKELSYDRAHGLRLEQM